MEVGSSVVSNKETVKYLGCVIDKSLSWESMSKEVLTKVNQRTKFLARNARYLDSNALRALAGALVQCHFDYACTSWFDSAPKTIKNRLQTAQNKLVRVILKIPALTHLEPSHFNSLGWRTVEK